MPVTINKNRGIPVPAESVVVPAVYPPSTIPLITPTVIPMVRPPLPRVRTTLSSVTDAFGMEAFPLGKDFESEVFLTSRTSASSRTAATSPRMLAPEIANSTVWPITIGASSFHLSSNGRVWAWTPDNIIQNTTTAATHLLKYSTELSPTTSLWDGGKT